MMESSLGPVSDVITPFYEDSREVRTGTPWSF